ncbi:MAG: IS66 family transposase [bacterium]|nr:IS66 family transposase [bacterium]
MQLTRDFLLNIDDQYLVDLSVSDPNALCMLSQCLLAELKVAFERIEQNSSNSSTPSGAMPAWGNKGGDEPLDDTEEETDDEEQPDTNPSLSSPWGSGETSRGESKRKPGRQQGSQGFGRTQKLPVTSIDRHYCTICCTCGANIRDEIQKAYTGFYSLDVVFGNTENPGMQLSNTHNLFYQARCPSCDKLSRSEPWREGGTGEWDNISLTQWRLIGPGLAALIIYLSIEMRLTRRMTVRLVNDFFGISVSVGSIHKCLEESARALSPIEDQLVEELFNDPLMHVDETPHKEAGTDLWLWVFVSATTALFYVGNRSSEIFQNVINAYEQPYAGWLMTDGYLVYRHFIKRLRCWAHLIRKAKGLAECYTPVSRQQGAEVLETLEFLIDAVYKAREGPPNFKPDSIAADYQQLLEKLRKTCEVMSCSSHEKTRALGVEFLRDWDAIFRVLDHPHLPLTNNEAERILRHWVIMRRITQGTRTEMGSKILGLYASIFATCRLREIAPLHYIESVIRLRRSGAAVLPLPMKQGCSI